MPENVTEYTANFCLLVMEYIEDYTNARKFTDNNAEEPVELHQTSYLEKVSSFFKNLSKKTFFHRNKQIDKKLERKYNYDTDRTSYHAD